MRFMKLTSALRGVTAVFCALLVLAVVGYGIADKWRSTVDDFLGTTSYEIDVDEENARYVSDYSTIEDMAAAAKDIAIREGEEGTAVLRNENGVLPLSTSNEVALFGLAAYAPYPYSSGDLKGGNDDAVDLVAALENAGFSLSSDVRAIYEKAMNAHITESTNRFTGEVTYSTTYDIAPQTSIGDMTYFNISERTFDDMLQIAQDNGYSGSCSVKNGTVGICVFARPGGESNMYAPSMAADYNGNPTGKDPLALSDIELSVVATAKYYCDKVIVLLNTGNNMEIGDLVVDGGDYEADGIAYIGCPNDYQFTGIVNVLSGKVNATGALADTYVYNNSSIPAVQNVGGDVYADYEVANSESDSRWGEAIANGSSDSFGGSSGSYSGSTYIVEAEGIYVGYKYYETRYYDSVANPSYNADSTSGSSTGKAWNYSDEVVYSFGYGLSYLDYEQNIRKIDVDKTPEGSITATIDVTNNSSEDGYFLAQLYVQQPYTQYDRTNGVEKSGIMFLNSAKVEVKAHSTESVEIEVPTKYLASYDYTGAKTYILDDGDYYFTAAAGSHAAVNNILTAQGYAVSDGMDAKGDGTVVTWNNNEIDRTTYAVENGTNITNVADNADLNYWLPGTVTYLSRQNWGGTYPINYNTDKTISISASAKKDEWIDEIQGKQYTIDNTGKEVENVDGKDLGLRFSIENIGYEQLTNIDDPYWDELVSQISVNEAVGAVLHGGSRSDPLSIIDNPEVIQNEGVNGFTTGYTTDDGKTYKFNISSQTLLGSSFNPELAYEWGLVEGNSGLWIQRYDVWGVGLTERRTPYNGRNYEYISEDPMLTNRIGYGVISGCLEKGILNGPKHMGFNDQEHNRAGVAEYMNEQKFRETDLRGFQGGLDDANGLAVMIAFNRIGPVNAAHHQGMIMTILRGEWGFNGLISTDMMSNKYYFCGESMIMAGITQVADFASGNSYISSSNNHSEGDSNWSYITINNIKNDATLCNQARQNIKYQLYAFANSAIMNISTIRVTPWWEATIKGVIIGSAVVFAVAGVAWIVVALIPGKKKTEEDK